MGALIGILLGCVVILILQAIMIACIWIWDNIKELKFRAWFMTVLVSMVLGYSLYHNTMKKIECDKLGAIVVQGTYNNLYCVKEIK